MNPWFYFGCFNGGHYLYSEGMQKEYQDRWRRLGNFDGSLCFPESEGLYSASITRLGGLNYSALSFWDRTGDKRPASNSSFFAPDLCIHPKHFLSEAQTRFPKIFARLPTIDLSRAISQAQAMEPRR
jgi:hypothetical protein